jgi:hypothetical protein
MKTAGRENPNRWVIVPRTRVHGAEVQNRSRSIQWAGKQEKLQPQERCFFLTSPFIELIRSWQLTAAMTDTVRTDSLPAAYQWTLLRSEKSLMNARRFCRAFLLILTLSVVGLLVLSAAQEAHPPHWAYEGKEGPKEWGYLDSSYAGCSVGKTQSPIDVRGAKKADLPVLNFSYQPSL